MPYRLFEFESKVIRCTNVGNKLAHPTGVTEILNNDPLELNSNRRIIYSGLRTCMESYFGLRVVTVIF